MTAGQLKGRKKWVLGNRKMKRSPSSNQAFWMHLRGFHKGDIRCVRCGKWINPKDPEEVTEIKISSGGKKLHDPRWCNYGNGYGIAAFATVSRHSPSRSRRVNEAKRY